MLNCIVENLHRDGVWSLSSDWQKLEAMGVISYQQFLMQNKQDEVLIAVLITKYTSIYG